MTSCPNSTESGCRCPLHHPGLGAYSKDPVTYALALAAAPQPRLHIVTMPPTSEPVCTGHMTCPCRRCTRERTTPRARAARQPWDPRPSRRAA